MTWLVKAQDVSWLCVVESVYCVLPSWSRHHGKPLYGEAFILVSWCWSHCRRDVGADKMPDKIIFASMCWIYPYQVPVHSCTILHPMYSIGIQCFPSRNFGLRTVLILKKPRFWRYLPFWLTVRVAQTEIPVGELKVWLEPAGSHASHDSPTVPPVVSLFLKKRFKVDQKYCDKDVLLWILLY